MAIPTASASIVATVFKVFAILFTLCFLLMPVAANVFSGPLPNNQDGTAAQNPTQETDVSAYTAAAVPAVNDVVPYQDAAAPVRNSVTAPTLYHEAVDPYRLLSGWYQAALGEQPDNAVFLAQQLTRLLTLLQEADPLKDSPTHAYAWPFLLGCTQRSPRGGIEHCPPEDFVDAVETLSPASFPPVTPVSFSLSDAETALVSTNEAVVENNAAALGRRLFFGGDGCNDPYSLARVRRLTENVLLFTQFRLVGNATLDPSTSCRILHSLVLGTRVQSLTLANQVTGIRHLGTAADKLNLIQPGTDTVFAGPQIALAFTATGNSPQFATSSVAQNPNNTIVVIVDATHIVRGSTTDGAVFDGALTVAEMQRSLTGITLKPIPPTPPQPIASAASNAHPHSVVVVALTATAVFLFGL